MSAGPLEGIRVLELGSFIAGPFAGQLLADLGAQVIKVEEPHEGDPMRRWGTMLNGRSIWWSGLARGKHMVAIDLRQLEGRALVKRLALGSDVVLENFAPGRLEAWGLGYESLSAENPRLVMARVSGFGQDGPRSDERGFGAIAEAVGGLRELTGWPDRPPARASVSLGDHISGLFAAFGILAALRQAERDGRGQVVDVALYEGVFALTESLVAEYELAGVIRTRNGGGLPGVAPSNSYPTADGSSVMIAANSDSIWRRLVEAMGRPELGQDDRYATHEARGSRTEEVDEIVSAWTCTREVAQIEDALRAAAVPHSRIYTAPDMLADAQFESRGMIERVYDDDLDREVPMPGVVPRFGRTPGMIRWAGAPLGEHTRQVLAEFGVSVAEVASLAADGVIPPR